MHLRDVAYDRTVAARFAPSPTICFAFGEDEQTMANGAARSMNGRDWFTKCLYAGADYLYFGFSSKPKASAASAGSDSR